MFLNKYSKVLTIFYLFKFDDVRDCFKFLIGEFFMLNVTSPQLRNKLKEYL